MARCMPGTRCLLGHGVICALCWYELHLESGGPTAVDTAVSVGSAARGQNIACLLLRLLHQPGERL